MILDTCMTYTITMDMGCIGHTQTFRTLCGPNQCMNIVHHVESSCTSAKSVLNNSKGIKNAQNLQQRAHAMCIAAQGTISYMLASYCQLAEPPLDLRKQLGRYLVARVTLNSPETSAAVIMLQQCFARFLELPQPLLPCVDGVVLSLCQRLARDIVLPRDLWCVEVCVVYPP